MNVNRCSKCGMGIVERQPADLKSLYGDAYYQAPSASDQGYEDYSYTAEHGLAWAASLIGLLVPRGRILDVGCANGHLLKKLQSSHECYGIEVNSKMADECRSAGIKIIGSDVFDDVVAAKYNAFFDVVSAIAVLEHLSDLKKGVQIVLSLLKPDGILLFEVPLVSAKHSSDIWFKSSLEHIYYPSESSLRYLIENVFNLPLVGREVVISDYGSTFVGVVPKNSSRGEELAREYGRLTVGPITELRTPEERRFRFLFDCLHAAHTSPAHLDLLKSIPPREINAAFLGRLADLWRRDSECLTESKSQVAALESTRDWNVSQLQRRNDVIEEFERELLGRDKVIEGLRSELTAKGAIIGDQATELEIFRTSKLQRLRVALLHEKFSLRTLVKIAYLAAGLATPERTRARLRPTVQWLKHTFERGKPKVKKLKQEKWPKSEPLISIVIPCFNYGRFVEEAVDSVLAQTFSDFEIIVVDGGSTDSDTTRLLQNLPKPKTQVYFRHSRHLVGDNRNFAIKRARGKYICCLDADDKLKPTYLEKALFLLETYKYDLVSTAVQCFGESDTAWQITSKPTLEQILSGNQFSTVAVFTKQLWSKAQGYHDWGLGKDHVAEDWDLWLRMMAIGARAINIPEPLMLYRVHGKASLSSHHDNLPYDKQSERIRLFNRKYLTRKNYQRAVENNELVVEVSNPFINLDSSYEKDRKMPALLLALPFVVTGGADTVFLQMAEHLAKSGFDLSIVTTIETDATLGDNTSKYEAITKQVYHLYRFLEDRRSWKDFLFYLIESREINILLLAGSAYVYDLLPEIKSRFPQIKIVDQLFNEFGHIENNRKHSGSIDFHIVANDLIKGILVDGYGENENRIRVIIHGVDVEDRFNPAKLEVGAEISAVIPKGKFIVSFIGRFSEEKSPARFVEIANLLKGEDSLHFLMIGNGPDYPRIKQRIRELELESRVYAPGFVPDLRAFLKASSVVVIPSNIEGIPIILMESLALGVPVIASAVGGIPSIIQDGFNGFLCEPSDIAGFVRAIKKVAAEQNLYSTMKTHAREYSVRHLDLGRTNREYSNLFAELLGTEHGERAASPTRDRENSTVRSKPEKSASIAT